MADYKYMLVGGCPRSGTTWVQFLLSHHSAIAITFELNLQRFLKSLSGLFYRENIIPGQRPMREKESWNSDDAKRLIFRSEMKKDVFDFMYMKHFGSLKDPEKIVFLADKHPVYYHYIDDVRAVLEPMYILHITRNPFDAINSMLSRQSNVKKGLDNEWGKKHQGIVDMCAEWNRAFNFIRKEEEENGERVTHVQYEDLVFNTRPTVRYIMERLGIDTEFDYSGCESDSDPTHHFSREELSEEIVREIYNQIDMDAYTGYLESSKTGKISLEHIEPRPAGATGPKVVKQKEGGFGKSLRHTLSPVKTATLSCLQGLEEAIRKL